MRSHLSRDPRSHLKTLAGTGGWYVDGKTGDQHGPDYTLLREECAPILSNSSSTIKFEMTLGDPPWDAGTRIATVTWGISESKLDVPDASFEDIGSPKALEALTGLDKAAARTILRWLLQGEAAGATREASVCKEC